ncbi:MAG: hypothetical protein V3V53_14870 [Bacteroidales bacterium]
MKTIKLLFVSAMVGISSFVFSGNALAFFIDLKPVDIPDKAVVRLEAPKNYTASIYIAGPEGDILLEESITLDEASTRLYDFTNLDNGIYTFHSSDEQSTTTKRIKVEGSSIEILSKEVEYKPIFNINDKSLSVNYLNMGSEDIEFIIEGKYSSFYLVDEGNEIRFRKQFDISKLPRGEYYALMNVGNKQYYHKFNVE